MTVNTDLDINRGIRRLLVKHWIDLGRISIRSTRGRVSMFGALNRIEGRLDPLNGRILDAMFYEMRRVPGVRAVHAHFENWSEEGGRWHPVEVAKDPGRGPSPAADTEPPD